MWGQRERVAEMRGWRRGIGITLGFENSKSPHVQLRHDNDTCPVPCAPLRNTIDDICLDSPRQHKPTAEHTHSCLCFSGSHLSCCWIYDPVHKAKAQAQSTKMASGQCCLGLWQQSWGNADGKDEVALQSMQKGTKARAKQMGKTRHH